MDRDHEKKLQDEYSAKDPNDNSDTDTFFNDQEEPGEQPTDSWEPAEVKKQEEHPVSESEPDDVDYRFMDHKDSQGQDRDMSRSGGGNSEEADPGSHDRMPQSGRGNRRRGLAGTLAMVFAGAVLGSAITLGANHMLYGRYQTPAAQVRSNSGETGSERTSIVTAPPADTGVTAENLIAENVTPSVVGITTRTRVNTSDPGPFFFGFPGSESYVQGVGSGVIVTEDGYILTNSHVVSNGEADKIQVIFSDETSVEGEVLWNDSALDLAIVKADATGLKPVEIGSSSTVKVGDKAIAIGNPLGMDLQSTLTSGYISGLDRSISISDGSSMSGLLQTDAAINQGNSGGALLNAAGQLIGINTAKAGGSTSGIGFAIPIDTATPIIERVMAEGSFQSVYLGVAGADASAVRTMGNELEYEGTDGVFILEIMEGTAADEAGLQVGDVITEIDGNLVSGMTELKTVLLNYEVGDSVEITYFRGREEKTLQLTFAQDSSNIEEYSSPEETAPLP